MGLIHSFYECDKEMCLLFSLSGKLPLLTFPCDALCLYLFVGGRQGKTFTGW